MECQDYSKFDKWANDFREKYRPLTPNEYDIAKMAYEAALASKN